MIVDLLPTEEQTAIRESVAGMAGRLLPAARLHDPACSAAGAEIAAWRDIAALGLFGLGLSEAEGGAGYGLAEEVTAARELGRFLVSPSVLATMLAVHAAPAALRAAFCTGGQRAAFANPLQPADFTAAGADVQLLDAQGARHAVLWNDHRLVLVEIADHGRPVEAIDETVSLSRVRLDLAAQAGASRGAALPRRAGLLLAAYLVGIAEAVLAMAVDYAKIRVQFGQPIGAFQAIKHYCAEMARRAEAALSQTFYAAIAAAARQDEDLVDMACARLLAGDAAVENARFNIQIHGAMGFTYEAGAHLFLKRALLVSAINSSVRQEQLRIMAACG